MKSHPYAPFIKWAMTTYFRGHWEDVGKSKATFDWVKSIGITAGRVDMFLRLDHSLGHTLPNSLVMDIVELSSSPLRRTLAENGLLDALLSTWKEMADVYGRVSAPADREMARLGLLMEWGNAVVHLPGNEFPGGNALVRQYWQERGRLDLDLLRPGRDNFKYVGMVVNLLSLHRRMLRSTEPIIRSSQGRTSNQSLPESRNEATSLVASGRDAQERAFERDRLPKLPTSDSRWKSASTSLADGLFGNWRDHWDNTLP